MIDIHNHTLFGVDDGPKDMALSLEMLREAVSQGVTDIILTPHYRKGMFPYNKEKVLQNLKKLRESVDGEHLPIRLYLGCELHKNDEILEQLRTHRVSTMAGTDYVLTEFSYEDDYDLVYETAERLRDCGYIPIIAHVERIGCLRKKPVLCEELQELGALIQCNAQAVLGREGFFVKRFTQTLLKHQWIDLIGSDAHNMDNRPMSLRDAWEYVCEKFDEDYAEELMIRNPGQILEQIDKNI